MSSRNIVICLLRLGDLAMVSGTLKRIKELEPQKRLEVIINPCAKPLLEMLPWVDKAYVFERDLLGQDLTDPQAPIFRATDRLEQFLRSLGSQPVSHLFNFTHNRLSGHLMSLIEAERKTGLVLHPDDSVAIHSSWLQYLNRKDVRFHFHYCDSISRSLGRGRLERPIQLLPTIRGTQEANALIKDKAPRILIQPFSADKKKEWSPESWVSMLNQIHILDSELQAILLCAPDEQLRALELISLAAEQNVDLELGCVSLAGVLSLCEQASVLVTVDTSIKHLASASDISIVELCLGSSQVDFTGTYSPQAIIVNPTVPCHPCDHSRSCHLATHECSEQLPGAVIASIAFHHMRGNSQALAVLAKESQERFAILRPVATNLGFWSYHSLDSRFWETDLMRTVDLLAQSLILEQEDQLAVPPVGSVALNLLSYVQQVAAHVNPREIFKKIERVFEQFAFHGEEIRQLEQEFVGCMRHLHDKNRWQELVQKTIDKRLFKLGEYRFLESQEAGSLPQLNDLRKLQERIKWAKNVNDIKFKIFRSIRSTIKDI